MNFAKLAAAAGVLSLGATAAASAQATQTVTFEVDAINQIGVTGSPSLVVNTAVAGSAPTQATSTGNTWAITTNQTGSKVTATLSANMPTGLTLQATLGVGSTGATSGGAKTLSTTGADVVTGLTKVAATGLSLDYTLDATAAAGVVASATRVVTFTVTGGS